MHTKILLYFIIYSFLGWCIESVYKTILEKRVVNSGFLHGPVCPIYGFGAIILIILLKGLSKNIVLLFVTSTLIMTIWEYVVGVILEKVFKTKYWDYSHFKYNINGRVCLKNSIYWGILGTLFIMIVHPFIESKINLISPKTLLYIDIVINIILLTDVAITVTRLLFIDKKIQQISEITNMIKEKLIELKQNDKLEKVYKENIQDVVEELRRRQAVIKFKVYKIVVRLKKAFPTMQSETINKFVSQKVDIQILKSKIHKNKRK